MRCPNCAEMLLEVAPDVYQCGLCGAGPNINGSNPTWALSFVDRVRDGYEATCVEYTRGAYVAYTMAWQIDEEGRRTGTPHIEDSIVLEPEELREFCLPILVRSNRPWEIQPGNLLESGMFDKATGVKEVSR